MVILDTLLEHSWLDFEDEEIETLGDVSDRLIFYELCGQLKHHFKYLLLILYVYKFF
jgi:hypothetical protein